jgi:POT family proton-dependent oligopeptide transporter
MVAGFWALFDQKGAAFILQARQMNLDVPVVEVLGLRLGGFRLAESQMNAVNPFLVLAIVPLFQGVVYPGLARLGVNAAPLRRMAVGMFLTMISFVVMAGIQAVIDGGARPHVFWQVIPILILTVGEVMISVTGLEFAFTQAPKTMKSTVMSFWLLTSAVGNLFTALISQWNRFHGAAYFLFFAGLMLFCSLAFVVLARRYRPVQSVSG